MKELRADFRKRKEEYEESLKAGGGGGRGEGGRAAEQHFVDSVRRELTEARDKQLKAEIRRLQTETVALEKELKQRGAEETKRVEEGAEYEENQLRAKEVSRR
jgi:restriction endonuclease S subunit